MVHNQNPTTHAVALVLLIICSAMSVNANIINVVADGTIACGSIIGATASPWTLVDNFIRIPKTVKHVTFTGCSLNYANIVFQLEQRRDGKNEPGERLLIEILSHYSLQGSIVIDGTYGTWYRSVTDVDFVGDSVAFFGLQTDAMSIVGGSDTFVADVSITVKGTSSSLQGYGRFASIVAGTVQRAKITVGGSFHYRHVCAQDDVTDIMVAGIRADHVNCVEIRLTANNQLIAYRSYTYSGSASAIVHAVIAGVVSYSGPEIDGNSVSIYLSSTGVPVDASLLVCLAITTIVLVWHHTKADRHEYWVTFGWGVLCVCFIMDPLRLVAVCVFRWVKDSGYDDENPENPKDGLFNSCGSMLRWFHPNEYDAIEHIPWFH